MEVFKYRAEELLRNNKPRFSFCCSEDAVHVVPAGMKDMRGQVVTGTEFARHIHLGLMRFGWKMLAITPRLGCNENNGTGGDKRRAACCPPTAMPLVMFKGVILGIQ
jgi:hypothetical protein